MTAEILFLKNLNRQLRFLKAKDREDFISNYKLQIYDRYKSGEKIIDIINSFETPETIAKNIYEELDINIEQSRKEQNKTLGISKIFLSLATILPQFLVFIFAIASWIIGGILIPTIPFCFIMFWINFDPLQAIGGALLSVGLLPLLSWLLIYIGICSYKFEKLFFKISVELMLDREFEINQNQFKNSKSKNITKIVTLTLFSVFTVFGFVGSFAGNKTIGGANISQNFLNTQETYVDYSNILNEEQQEQIINIDFANLENHSWSQIKLVPDAKITNKQVLIKRDHNYKESLKLEYNLTKTSINNSEYTLEVNLPWNLLIFNLSNSIFTVTYNPNEIKLV